MPKDLETAVSTSETVLTNSAGKLALFGESRTGGNLIRRQAIRANIDYLRSLQGMAEQAGSYESLLSGESEVSSALDRQGLIPDKLIFSRLGIRDTTYLTFGVALKGPDYSQLKSRNPLDRYKFYSSFNLTSSDKVAVGGQWITDVVKRAQALNISLTTKSFDHAYDSLNLYTWHPAALAGIIQDLYPTYAARGLYHTTPHFFQGSLVGVDPNHVGFVQEPVEGWPPNPGHSHSGRMGVLGAAVDTYMQTRRDITPEQFALAAQQAGVRPEQPYLIAA